ncbi:MAG: GNAT family N-acetyltransferase [bacterium]|nr:GNAT family N-acetyltransferase [bacterium]
MNAPTLESARLRLRAHGPSDLAACAAMWSDPEVTRYIGARASNEQQTWSRVLAYAGHWALLGFGYWLIEERESGAFVGEIGFADFHRALAPAMRDVPEFGFALAAAYHGRGYGTEAARAVHAWGDEHLASDRTVCITSPLNAPSRAVVEKLGYRCFEETRIDGAPILCYERRIPR